MAKVVIFGAGQMAEIAHLYLSTDTEHEVVAFTVDGDCLSDRMFKGLPVVPFESIHTLYSPAEYHMFVLLGGKDCNRFRESKYNEAKERGYRFISFVSSKAIVCPKVKIGENCFILENNVLQPFVTIGDNCVLWSGNHVGHHSIIRNHCYLASHIVVSGGVDIGSYCYLGVNATLRDHIQLAEGTVVGAGALIMKSTVEDGVYVSMGSKKAPMSSRDVDLP